MDTKNPWHENDSFWETWGPMMFTPQKMTDAVEEVTKIITLLNIHPGSSILDLCCGIGRHSLELARWGYQVTGVDRTRGYLDKARKQAQEEGLNIEFVQEDMRLFSRPGSYDSAISMFTSFSYFEDPQEDKRVVKNVFESLRNGGRFIIQMHGKETLAKENEIKLEQKFSYLKIYFMIVLVTGTLDVFISLAIYLSHFYGYFTLKTMDSSESMAIAGSVFPLLVFICILIILMVLLFILFILKRSVRILKQYYLTVLIAIISALLMFVLRGLQHLGWYENVESQLLLFSVSYSYLGYIFLALLIVTIFSNATSILIYANLEKFTNTIKFKHRVITFIKIGFVTLIAFIILSIVPDLLIWIYT